MMMESRESDKKYISFTQPANETSAIYKWVSDTKKADCYENMGIVFESKYKPVDCNMISVLTRHQTSTRLPNHYCITDATFNECK